MQEFIEKQARELSIPINIIQKFFIGVDATTIIPNECFLFKSFFSKERSDELFKKLMEEIPFKTEKIKMYGKEVTIPRKLATVADKGVSYKFTGINHTPDLEEWPPYLTDIRKEFNTKLGSDFNLCLLNYYEDGNNYIGYHSDDERGLGGRWIASVSFGATRDFLIKHNTTKEVTKVVLSSGDLLLMSIDMQKEYKHSLPVRKKISSPRLNLTFRCMI